MISVPSLVGSDRQAGAWPPSVSVMGVVGRLPEVAGDPQAEQVERQRPEVVPLLLLVLSGISLDL